MATSSLPVFPSSLVLPFVVLPGAYFLTLPAVQCAQTGLRIEEKQEE